MEAKAPFFVSTFLLYFICLQANTLQTYIVQLHPHGITNSYFNSKLHWHLSYLEKAVSTDEEPSSRLLYSYGSAMEGFAALLSDPEVKVLRNLHDVIAVRPDRRLEIHTTYSYKPGMMSKMIKRQLTNVGNLNSTFSVEVMAPEGVKDTNIVADKSQTAEEKDLHCSQLLMNCNPFWLAYRSMNLMNLSQSRGVRMTYFASIPAGLPLRNLALTSTD
ncbi:hypothetical protein RJ639_009742 [Escallonia herrerae]|uniref:Inhibitor I9 domain-containing protein n=1 Tax=Escallonia herrerae TaxID=1293975 RepID=A0AA89AW87_9ASTE|nr:hypothetical protein RJ639_009742 [Escallonia herrerae]